MTLPSRTSKMCFTESEKRIAKTTVILPLALSLLGLFIVIPMISSAGFVWGLENWDTIAILILVIGGLVWFTYALIPLFTKSCDAE